MPPGGIIAHPPLPTPVGRIESNGRVTSTLDAKSVRIDECPAEVVIDISSADTPNRHTKTALRPRPSQGPDATHGF